jgi:hypothetical protein
MTEKGWLQASINQTITAVEEYFIDTSRWRYSPSDICNVNINFEQLQKDGHISGNCGDESLVVSALAISWGIATTLIQKWYLKEGDQEASSAHMHTVYYDPSSRQWRAARKQLEIGGIEKPAGYPHLYFVKPPINVTGSLKIDWPLIKGLRPFTGATYVPTFEEAVKIYDMLLGQGISCSQMKRWLLYS